MRKILNSKTSNSGSSYPREAGGDAILDIECVEKAFGTGKAVDKLSLTLHTGALYGLLGPNGAGKTTTIRMIMRILLPDAGRIRFNGRELDNTALRSIGYLPEERGLYQKMRVDEQLAFLAGIRGVRRSTIREKTTYWANVFGLAEYTKTRVEQLSKGLQQKLQLAAAFVHDPMLVVLDEPFAGLDPANVEMVKEVVRNQRSSGVTFLISTHMMDQVEELCDFVCLIHKGTKIIDGPVGKVRESRGRMVLQVSYKNRPTIPVASVPGIREARQRGDGYEVVPDWGWDPRDVAKALMADPELRTLELRPPSMREVFLEATS
jgi:ABC-2 type transport system ATP-binding protein